MELVKSLGAHWVIDYTKEDFTRKKGSYEIIFDTVGKSSFSKSKASLKKNGRYLTSTGKMMKNYFLTIWTSLMARRKFIFAMSVDKVESLNLLKKLAEAGIIKPIIDRTYPLEEMVEAHRYVEMGHKKGNVVIRVN
jgi:NADPH:quinone reductase-like Zn-dependent oxidoreductase